jgi:hypothetical protein
VSKIRLSLRKVNSNMLLKSIRAIEVGKNDYLWIIIEVGLKNMFNINRISNVCISCERHGDHNSFGHGKILDKPIMHSIIVD